MRPIIDASIPANVAAPIAINPTTLVFGGQKVGAMSAPRTIHLVNLGPGRLVVASVALRGSDKGDFSVRSTCSGRPIDVDQGCTINIRFAPTTAGARTASVVIRDHADSAPHTIPLAG